jgi:hypothetical protein
MSEYNSVLAFWRPGDANAVKVTDTANHQNDSPDANLAFRDRTAGIVLYAARDDDPYHQIWVSRPADADGTKWSEAEVMPHDGGNSVGAPVQIAIAPSGRLAVTAPVDGGNSDGTRCGHPKLFRPGDAKGWTVCSPESAKGVPTGDARLPMSAFAANDKLYMVFATHASAGPLKPGLVVWRER